MTYSAEHNATACRSSKHTRVQHLVTADETSFADLEALIATLPLCSTGRVFIEVPDASWEATITAPARMVVTWLDRSRRSGAPGTGRACAPGEALARAVNAWADEMLCGEVHRDADGDAADAHTMVDHTRVFLLGGYLGTADIVDHLTGSLAVASAAIHTPERFGLATAR